MHHDIENMLHTLGRAVRSRRRAIVERALDALLASTNADAVGVDDRGPWLGIAPAGVDYLFRWVPAGVAVIERERHEVPRGCFFGSIFVTNAFWDSVHGYQGSRRAPTEAPLSTPMAIQHFARTLSERYSGLTFGLPTEAEYALATHTTYPFVTLDRPFAERRPPTASDIVYEALEWHPEPGGALGVFDRSDGLTHQDLARACSDQPFEDQRDRIFHDDDGEWVFRLVAR